MIRGSWMVGASTETTLGLWASSLRDVKARIRPLFRQERVAASAWNFLDGLLGSEPRKTGWMRAEAAGDLGPWRQQAILGRGRWDAEALRDMVRDYALESETGQGVVRRCAPVYGLGGQDHQLPDRRVRVLCRAMAMPSSTGRFICRRHGRTIPNAWRRRMCRMMCVLRRNRKSRAG